MNGFSIKDVSTKDVSTKGVSTIDEESPSKKIKLDLFFEENGLKETEGKSEMDFESKIVEVRNEMQIQSGMEGESQMEVESEIEFEENKNETRSENDEPEIASQSQTLETNTDLFQNIATATPLEQDNLKICVNRVTDAEKSGKLERPNMVDKADDPVVQPKLQVIAKPKQQQSYEAKKIKNVREISVFDYLFERQSQIRETSDAHVHGRFCVLEADLVDGRVKLGFVRNSLELNIR
jgi:hypothetical protein